MRLALVLVLSAAGCAAPETRAARADWPTPDLSYHGAYHGGRPPEPQRPSVPTERPEWTERGTFEDPTSPLAAETQLELQAYLGRGLELQEGLLLLACSWLDSAH